MANLEIRQERVQRGEACGVARRRGIDIGNSFLGGSELGENLLGDLGQRKKKEKKQTPPRYGNYKGRRYLILAVKEGQATIQRLDGSQTLTVALDALEDVSSVRESKKEQVCYVCHLPWSVCEVGGRDRRGIPFGPDNPIDYGQ